MSHIAFFLLGSPRIERDGIAVDVDTRKAVALFAYLAVTKQRHTRDALATLLWPEYGQTSARAALRRTLSALNGALKSDRLAADRETIGLAPVVGLWLDVDTFHDHLAECRAHEHPPSETCPRCRRPLEEAVDLYRDDFMAGFSLRDSPDFDEWQYFQAEGLRRELAGALEQLVKCCVAADDFAPAISHARRWLALDRLHEAAHRHLMLLYAWSGQRAAALRQYRDCAQVLEQELEVEPLEATTHLYAAIKANRLPPPDVESGSQGRQLEPTQSPRSRVQSDLVGRVAEWNALLHAYDSIAAGGQVVALVGEAGIGKTRLAEEFLAHALSVGAESATTRSYEGEAGLAYGPVVALLRGLLDKLGSEQAMNIVSPQWLSEAARLVPEIAAAQPALPPAPPLDSPGAQSRFFEGIRQVLLGACSGEQPGVLFFDDLQWADAASIDLLTYLVRRLDGWPICLLLAWRSDTPSAGHRLVQMLTQAHHSGLATLLPLGRLNQAQVEDIVRLAVGQDDHSLRPAHRPATNNAAVALEALAQRLYAETEGLPFFVVEYLAAISNSLGEGEQVGWPLPGGVRDLLRSRLMAVSETGKQLLNTGAVIGRSFDFDTLREASGRGEEEVVAGLEELMGRGLVVEMRSAGEEPSLSGTALGGQRAEAAGLLYDFSHEKLRALVYEETSLARRRLLHRRVAQAMAGYPRSSRGEEALASQIAHHYEQAGEEKLAADFYKRAGEHARALYANAEAILHFRAALALGHRDVATLQEALGDLYTLRGEYAAAIQSYHAAQNPGEHTTRDAAGEGPGYQVPVSRIEHKLGGVYLRRGEWQIAESHFEKALQDLQDTGTEGARSRILADWSLAAYRRGHLQGSADLANQAITLAEAGQDRHALAQAYNVLGILASNSGDLQASRSHLERSLELAKALEDPGARVAALNNLALALQAGGDYDRAVALTEEAIALSVSQGDRHREAALHNNLADLLHSMGRSEASMRHLKQAVAIYAEIGVEAGDVQPAIWKLAEW